MIELKRVIMSSLYNLLRKCKKTCQICSIMCIIQVRELERGLNNSETIFFIEWRLNMLSKKVKSNNNELLAYITRKKLFLIGNLQTYLIFFNYECSSIHNIHSASTIGKVMLGSLVKVFFDLTLLNN